MTKNERSDRGVPLVLSAVAGDHRVDGQQITPDGRRQHQHRKETLGDHQQDVPTLRRSSRGIKSRRKPGIYRSSLRGKAGLKREKLRGDHTSQASEKIHCGFEPRLLFHGPTRSIRGENDIRIPEAYWTTRLIDGLAFRRRRKRLPGFGPEHGKLSEWLNVPVC